MSLLRLLTAGKSLIGVPPVMGRYRMTNPKSLPRFGDGKNPFQGRATRSSQSEETPAGKADVTAVVEVAAAEAELVEMTGPELTAPVDAAKEVIQTAPEAAQDAKEATGAPARAAGGRAWISKLSSLKIAWRWGGSGGARSAKLVAPVQGELSLDKIKVVRNDLSETDLEVVPLRLRPKNKLAEAAPGEQAQEQAEMTLAEEKVD